VRQKTLTMYNRGFKSCQWLMMTWPAFQQTQASIDYFVPPNAETPAPKPMLPKLS
jgi:hypothetical protein